MEQKEHNPGYLAIVNDAKARVKRINLAGYMKLYFAGTPHILVDTREESEWKAGHVTGAVHLGRGIIERDIEETIPDKDTTLVLYCRAGSRSALVADNLQRMGYRNAISLDGGWSELEYSGLELEEYRQAEFGVEIVCGENGQTVA